MSRFASKTPQRIWLYGSAGFVFLISFFLRKTALDQTAFANGWDTYYYLVQLKSILEEGRMHSEEWTLLYPLLLVLNFFIRDPVTLVKILSAFLAACLSVMMFFNAWAFRKSIAFCLFIASFSIFSPELTYFAAQWPKNLLGLVVFLGLLLSIKSENKYAIIATLVLGFFCHRMTAVLGVLVFIVYSVSKKISPKQLLIIIAFLFMITVAGLIFPGTFHLKDLERLSGFLSNSPQIPFFSFYKTFGFEKIRTWWILEFFLCTGLFIIILVLTLHQLFNKKKKRNTWNIVLILLFSLLWFPFYQWDLASVSYRFFHAGVILAPLLLISWLNEFSFAESKFLIIPAIIFLFLSLFSWKSYQPDLHDPPFGVYKNITAKAEEVFQKNSQKPELVIAHKALAEYFSYSTPIDAMFWIPEYEIDSKRLFRIAVLPFPQMFKTYANEEPIGLGGDYYLVKEKDWQVFITEMEKRETPELVNQHLTWKNPNEKRPAYLRK